MTDRESTARRVAARTRTEQGLGVHVTDPVTLSKIAALVDVDQAKETRDAPAA